MPTSTATCPSSACCGSCVRPPRHPQQQVSAQLEAHFGDKVFKAMVPRNVRLAEAPSHGIPGVVFDRSAKGAQAYLAFAKE